MNIEKVSSYNTKVQTKNGGVSRVAVKLTLEDEDNEHKFEFIGISEEQMSVRLQQHHVSHDYKENVAGTFDRVDYELKLDDEALDSINEAREAVNRILEENDLEWKVGGLHEGNL